MYNQMNLKFHILKIKLYFIQAETPIAKKKQEDNDSNDAEATPVRTNDELVGATSDDKKAPSSGEKREAPTEEDTDEPELKKQKDEVTRGNQDDQEGTETIKYANQQSINH